MALKRAQGGSQGRVFQGIPLGKWLVKRGLKDLQFSLVLQKCEGDCVKFHAKGLKILCSLVCAAGFTTWTPCVHTVLILQLNVEACVL